MDEFEQANELLNAGDGPGAMRIFLRLAEGGRIGAMHAAAHAYLYGSAGVERDYEKAFLWFSRGAANGCPQAMYHLGICNSEGFGTPRNPVLALEWFRKSAAKCDEDAEYRVGDCYEKGIGTAADRDEAIRWYRLAAEHGQPDAKERLKELE